MQRFVDEHRAMIVRYAAAATRAQRDAIAAEDVAREIELVLVERGGGASLEPTAIPSPNAYLRGLASHALGRARRRRTLVQQLAAGDDLDALSRDLAALDADLPPAPPTPSRDSRSARASIDRVKQALAPRDALLFALLYEDGGSLEEAADALSMPLEEVAAARERIAEAAAANGLTIDATATGGAQ